MARVNEEHAELVDRLTRLERENRRIKRVGGAILVLMGLLGLSAAAQQRKSADYDIVTARQFRVVDGEGNCRGMIGMSETTPRIFLGPNAANPQLLITAQDEQVILDMKMPGEHPLVRLNASRDLGAVSAPILRGRLEPPATERGK